VNVGTNINCSVLMAIALRLYLHDLLSFERDSWFPAATRLLARRVTRNFQHCPEARITLGMPCDLLVCSYWDGDWILAAPYH